MVRGGEEGCQRIETVQVGEEDTTAATVRLIFSARLTVPVPELVLSLVASIMLDGS